MSQMSLISGARLLEEARTWLLERLADGETCPCCGQYAKEYRRTIHASMASALIKTYRAGGRERRGWVTIKNHLDHPELADFAKLAHWSLVEAKPGERDDGSKRVGIWRVTDMGEEFVAGRLAVAKYARVFNGECRGHDPLPMIGIRDCLAKTFNYEELMRA